jgi:signal transduction histidine kinase
VQKSILPFICLLCSLVCAQAQSVGLPWPGISANSVDTSARVYFEEYYYFHDTRQQYTLDDVAAGRLDPATVVHRDSQLISITGDSCYWVIVKIHNTTGRVAPLWYMTTWMYTYGYYENWIFSEGKPVRYKKDGRYVPQREIDQSWPGDERYPIKSHKEGIRLILDPDETVTIITRSRCKHHSGINLNPRVWVIPYERPVIWHFRYHWPLLLTGMSAMLLIYNLLLFFQHRKRLHIFYFLFILTSSVNSFLSFDFWMELPLGNYPEWTAHVKIMARYAIPLTYALFLLEVSRRSSARFRWQERLTIITIGLMGLEFVLGSVHQWRVNHFESVSALAYGAMLLLIVTGIISMWQVIFNLRQHFWIGMGNIVFIVSSTIYLLFLAKVYLAVLPSVHTFFELYGEDIFHVGIIVQFILYSVGLEQQTRQIELDKNRYQELDALKTNFFNNISHEFRTPLTLIIGPLNKVLRETKSTVHQPLLQTAVANAQRLLALVNQLLDIAKMEAGQMTLAVREQNLIPFLHKILFSFESLAAGKNIALDISCPATDLLLFFDEDKFEKIFNNLLSNAIKFTDAGQIRLSIAREGAMARIAVSDTGRGMKPDELPHIFNRFHQASSAANRPYEGTGIGLALVKEFTELHHGRVTVQSVFGEGTEFVLYFPLGSRHFRPKDFLPQPDTINDRMVRQSTTPPETPVALPIPATQTGLPVILVIEDNAEIRFFIRQHLARHFTVFEAVDGEDGLEKAGSLYPQLIICDVMMPKKDGYEVCKVLKNNPKTNHIPIILLTAKSGVSDKLQGLALGVDDYLSKPFDERELLLRVNNAIRQRTLQQEKIRSKLSSDLHDDVGSILSGLAMQAQIIAYQAPNGQKNALQEISSMSRDAMERMRDTVWALDSRKDKFENLVDRMRAFAEQHLPLRHITCAFEVSQVDLKSFIDPESRQNLYLIFKEAITNIIKHSNARHVRIALRQENHQFRFTIHDDGTPANPCPVSDGLGLASMHLRATNIGAQLTISITDGFRVDVVW